MDNSPSFKYGLYLLFEMYKIGTIKVAWTTKGNYNELNSQMFTSLEEALQWSKGMKDFMIMRLIDVESDNYKWEVLPYGNYPSYRAGMIISENLLIFMALTALLGFGLYRITKNKSN